MGEEIRPEYHPPVRGLVYEAEGKALADQIRRIYRFSAKRGIRSITDFLDNRDMPEDDFNEDQWNAARGDWHAPSEGLQAIGSLLDAIRADPKAAKHWNKEDPDGLETLLDDLEALANSLEKADARGVKFRLTLL
jgi:hypothetical protein